MKEFPDARTYELFFRFMPWGTLINEVAIAIKKEAPENSSVLDVMCGPGYLLGEIKKLRPDLLLQGIDKNKNFINYAQTKYSNIKFKQADIITYNESKKYDIVLCTGGVHHLFNEDKINFLMYISTLLKINGFAIIGDPYVDDFSNEIERRLAANNLGYAYLNHTIKNNAPIEIVEAAIDILYNDVMGFEYKTSIKKIKPILKRFFSQIKIFKTFPDYTSDFGDYYFICKNNLNESNFRKSEQS